MNFFILLFLAKIISYITCQDNADYEEQRERSAVINLTKDNFHGWTSSQESYFIEFYAPWCGHCKKLAPIYEEAAKISEKNKLPFKFAKIDADKASEIGEEWEVMGYPSVYFVHLGEKSKYKGKRSADSFIKFAKQKLGILLLEINSLEELNSKKVEAEEAQSSFLLIQVSRENYSKEGIKTKIDAILSVYDHINFFSNIYITHNVSLLTTEIDEIPALYAFTLDKNNKFSLPIEQIPLDKEEYEDNEILVKKIAKYARPLYSEINDEEVDELVEHGFPTLIMFYPEGIVEKLHNLMISLAKEKRGVINFFYSHLSNNATSIIVDVLKIKEEDLPTLIITHDKGDGTKDLDKFRLDNIDINLIDNGERIINFLKDYLSGNVDKFFASEDIPVEPLSDEGIYKIVGKTFQDVLSKKHREVVLLVCSNVYERCKKFRERYIRVRNKFSENEGLLFSETDPNINEYGGNIVIPSIFPTILFFHAHNETDIHLHQNIAEEKFINKIKFEGNFTTANITEFIKAHSNITNLKVKLPTEDEEEIFFKEILDKIIPSEYETDEDMPIEEEESTEGRVPNPFGLDPSNAEQMKEIHQQIKNKIQVGEGESYEGEGIKITSLPKIPEEANYTIVNEEL
jgi:protein disulfide-isomerase A1